MSTPEVDRDDVRHRYEITVDGEVVGFSQFRDRGDVREVYHTEIADGWQGQGLATRLIEGLCADIRSSGLGLQPTCPMAASYLTKHPEDADLVRTR